MTTSSALTCYYLLYNYAEFDFNTSTTSLTIPGRFLRLFSASALVVADDVTEGDEGFILYLEVDDECTNLGDVVVVRLDNNATLVNITEIGWLL